MWRSVFALSFTVSAFAKLPEGYHPVVVAGPLMGQSLEIKNDASSLCNKGKWQWLWGNPNLTKGVQPVNILCLLDGLKLAGWDSKEKMSIPKPKIHVRPLGGFDNSALKGISSFFGTGILDGGADDSHLGPRLRSLGYVDDESFIGHSYDWRLGVKDWQVSSFPVLRELIENARKAAGAKVVLTGISMAGPYFHAFLSWTRTVDPAWVDDNVHAFVPVSAPWNGAAMAASALVSSVLQTWSTDGECPDCDPARKQSSPIENDGKSLVDQLKLWFKDEAKHLGDEVLKKIVWNWPSIYWMSPAVDFSTDPPTDPEVVILRNGAAPPQCSANYDASSKCGATQTRNGWSFDSPDFLSSTQCAQCYEVSKVNTCASEYELASKGWLQNLCCKRHKCDARSYRASELPDFFRVVGRAQSAEIMEYALSVGTTMDPGVPVHCIFSHNIQTFTKMEFDTTEDTDKSLAILADGDQTVNSASLEVCTRWRSTVKVYRVPGAKHASTLDVDQVIDVIEAIATNDEAKWRNWQSPALAAVKTSYNTSIVGKSELFKAYKEKFLQTFV